MSNVTTELDEIRDEKARRAALRLGQAEEATRMSKIGELEEKIAVAELRIDAIIRDEAEASVVCDDARKAIARGDGEPRALAASVADAESISAILNQALQMASNQLRELEAELAAERDRQDAAQRAARLDELNRVLEALRAKDAAIWESARDALAQSINAILDLRDEAALVRAERAQLNGQAMQRADLFAFPLDANARGSMGVARAFEVEAFARERAAQNQRYEAARKRLSNAPVANGFNVVGVAEESRSVERDIAETDHYDERYYQELKEGQLR